MDEVTPDLLQRAAGVQQQFGSILRPPETLGQSSPSDQQHPLYQHADRIGWDTQGFYLPPGDTQLQASYSKAYEGDAGSKRKAKELAADYRKALLGDVPELGQDRIDKLASGYEDQAYGATRTWRLHHLAATNPARSPGLVGRAFAGGALAPLLMVTGGPGPERRKAFDEDRASEDQYAAAGEDMARGIRQKQQGWGWDVAQKVAGGLPQAAWMFLGLKGAGAGLGAAGVSAPGAGASFLSRAAYAGKVGTAFTAAEAPLALRSGMQERMFPSQVAVDPNTGYATFPEGVSAAKAAYQTLAEKAINNIVTAAVLPGAGSQASPLAQLAGSAAKMPVYSAVASVFEDIAQVRESPLGNVVRALIEKDPAKSREMLTQAWRDISTDAASQAAVGMFLHGLESAWQAHEQLAAKDVQSDPQKLANDLYTAIRGSLQKDIEASKGTSLGGENDTGRSNGTVAPATATQPVSGPGAASPGPAEPNRPAQPAAPGAEPRLSPGDRNAGAAGVSAGVESVKNGGSAAFRDDTGKVYDAGPFHDTGKLPADVKRRMEDGYEPEAGFLTNKGRFVTRDEAAKIEGLNKGTGLGATAEDLGMRPPDARQTWKPGQPITEPEDYGRTSPSPRGRSNGTAGEPSFNDLHYHPAQKYVPAEAPGWLMNEPSARYPDDKNWQTYTDPHAPMGQFDQAKLAEAAAREPDPKRKMKMGGTKAARFQLAKADWDLVSRLMPEQAAQVKKVVLRDPGTTKMRASFNAKNGILFLPKGRKVEAATLYHEMIHAEQYMRDPAERNHLLPHAERSDEQHLEIEREAISREGQVRKARLFERMREMVNANMEKEGGPLAGMLGARESGVGSRESGAEPMPSAARVTSGKTVAEEMYAQKVARAGGDTAAYEEIRRQKEAKNQNAVRPAKPEQQPAAADPAAIDARLRAQGLNPETPAYERAYRDALDAAGGNSYNPGEHALPPGEEARELKRGRAMGARPAAMYGEAAAGTARVAAVQSGGTVPARPRPSLREAARSAGQGTWDAIKRLANIQLPAMRRVDPDIADAANRVVRSREYGQEKAQALVQSVFDEALGHKATEAELRKYGTAMVEKLRLELIRDAQDRQAKELADKAQQPDATPADKGAATRAARAAEEAATVIGPDSPIRNQLELHRVWNSPEMLRILQGWAEKVSPTLDENYRKGQWLEPDKEIEDVETQTPGLTLNLKRFDPTTESPSAGTVLSGGRRSSWANMILRRNPFAKRATGGSEGYETNAAELLKHSLGRAQRAADENDFYRMVEQKGQGTFGKPGQKLEMNGQQLEEVPLVRPKHPESSFYMNPDLAGEWKQILNVEDRYRVPGISGATRLATTAALTATGTEALAHVINHQMLPLYPKWRPFDVLGQWYKVIRGDPTTQNRVAELAREGAMKPRGYEGGRLLPEAWKNFDPTTWTGKALDSYTRAVRLAADQMYTRMVDAGEWKDTAEGRRNFLNKFGNYSKETQSQIVRALRESGLNPFATAQTTFLVGSLERAASPIVGVPGVEHTSTAAALRTRASMFAKIIAVASIGPVINAMKWGRWDGDDNTPIFAIKTGDNPDGSTSYLDPMKFAGLRRGPKAPGIETAVNRLRAGQSGSTAANAAEAQLEKTLTGLPMGPAGQFVHTGLTGKNFSGTSLVPDNAPGYERWLRAAANVNPVVSELTESNVPYFVKERPGVGERVARGLVGPLMPQKARAPRDPEAYRTIVVPAKGRSNGTVRR